MQKIFLLLIFTLFFSQVQATHNRAGEITFKQTGNLTFEISVITYTKASSLNADRDSLEVFFGDGSSKWVLRVNGTNNQGVIVGNDIKMNVYTTTHMYSTIGTYTIAMTDPNRNGGILNVNHPFSDQVPFHLETELKILNAGTNQSPVLIQPPIDNGCTNQTYTHNPIAYDADGDSLAFALTTPLMSPGTVVSNYVFPQNVNGNQGNALSIDPITGNLTWNSPQLAGEYNITFFIKEYRNGVLISTTIRDMQITINSCNNRPPSITSIAPIIVDARDTINFDILVNDLDGNAVNLTGFDGLMLNNSTFSVVNNGTSNPIGTFTWVTTCDDRQSSNHILVFRAEDDFVFNGQTTPSVDYMAVPIYLLNPVQNPCSPLVSTRKIELEQDLKVYPNPATDFLNIELKLDDISDIEIRLFNLLGQTVFNKNTTDQILNEQIQTAQLQQGIYILSLTIDGQQITKKIMIK